MSDRTAMGSIQYSGEENHEPGARNLQPGTRNQEPGTFISPRWLLPLCAFGLATVLGAIAAGQHHILMVNEGGDLTMGHALSMGMPYWYLWAILTPLVVWFAKRFPLDGSRLWLHIAVHVTAAIGITLLHSTLEVGFRTIVGLNMQASLLQFTRSSLIRAFYSLAADLAAYGAILGVYHAYTFSRRLKEREVAASRLAAQLAQARLEALRSQLKPHFFFNAMNTVAMLVRAQDNSLAIRTLTGMSDLLRHVLQENPPALVPLREELEFVERYLEIERTRFRDRLQFTLQADEDTLDALVPNLLLQPLVENAVRHGVGARAGASSIAVRATLQGDRLLLAVSDDGPGFSSRSTESAGHGVGLRNTRATLRELYGGAASLELRDAPQGGATVAIELPMQVAETTLQPVQT